ncbi:MAG: NADH-quinone oxidoreductase subunit H [Candidatus Marsarchaeota archaeon]|nr:NADH-quinone oxidoreductase subunit H [Candidatus Marsarchaeota archaeon]
MPILSLASSYLNLTGTAATIVDTLVYAIAVSVLIIAFDYIFGWLERKTIAKIQRRHGPTYAGKYGLLQNMADFVKLLAKEHVAPKRADKLLFLSTIPTMLALTIFLVFLIPLAPTLIETNVGLGLLVVFVLLSFMPLIIFANGFGSGNKFAAISAQRSVVMLLSYEVPLIFVIAAVGALGGSYSLAGLVGAQNPWWFVVLMPIGFVVFFIAMLAEVERPPFDIREADNELIAGWLTDVSAPYYTLALFLDYSRMLLGSLLIAILFFGGWSGPLLPPFVWLLLKAFVISFFIMIIRATMVRMRIDRLLRFGWALLLPLSLINLILTYLVFIR